MENKEIGLIVLFVAVIVGFVAVFQVNDFNIGENNGVSPANGSSMDNLPGQFDSMYLSQTTNLENSELEFKMEIWYRKTDDGIDYKQVQTIGENAQIQIYNSKKENLYLTKGGQWIYRELPYENFENSIKQTLGIFDGIAMNQSEGENYPLQGTTWTIQSLEKNSEIEEGMFMPPENAPVISFSEFRASQMLQQQ